MLCYSVADRKSFTNIEEFWIPEIKPHCPDTAIILVGKHDIFFLVITIIPKIFYRNEMQPTWLSPKLSREVEKLEGEELALRIGAVGFFECSAKENINVDVMFEAAVRVTMNNSTQSCNSLLGCNLVTNCVKKNFSRK